MGFIRNLYRKGESIMGIHDNRIYCLKCNKENSMENYLSTLFKSSTGYNCGECSFCGYETFPIDEDIIPVVRGLREKKYLTDNCCIGGNNPLYVALDSDIKFKTKFKYLNQSIEYGRLVLRLKKKYINENKKALKELISFILTLEEKKEISILIPSKRFYSKKNNSKISLCFNQKLSLIKFKGDKYKIISKDSMLTKTEFLKIRMKKNIVIEDINSLQNVIPYLAIYPFAHNVVIIVPMNKEKEKEGIPTFNGWGSFRDHKTYGLYKILKTSFEANSYIVYNEKMYLI
jgi:hypothetical protein